MTIQSPPSFEREVLVKIVNQFQGQPVLVLGDVMLDRYWWGTVDRISPEAPVPVVCKRRSSSAPGGAANAAANIAALGGTAILFSVIGADEAGQQIRQLLQSRQVDCAGLRVDSKRVTTVKTRVVAHGQHVVRIDEEVSTPLADAEVEHLEAKLAEMLPLAKAVLLSDYAKGVLTPALLRRVFDLANQQGVPVLVDPKGNDYYRYAGATIVTPNRSELALATGLPVHGHEDVVKAGQQLLEMLEGTTVLVTEGKDGMTLLLQDRAVHHLPTCARQVFDVTGAGDTVIAAFTLAVAAGADLLAAAWLANQAAGLAVEQVGTVAVTRQKLLATLNRDGAPH